MIITLEDARKIDPSIEQDDLDAFEQAVRALTSNNFQVKQIRYGVLSLENDTVNLRSTVGGIRKGDTVEINYTSFNNGVYEVLECNDTSLILNAEFFTERPMLAILTLVRYPADVKRGIKKLIEYDKKMTGKIGIKSETISRMSTTYYDVGAADNTDGYPKALLSFLDKYKKMRWS